MYDLPASMNVGIRPSLGRGINRWFHNEAPEVQTELRLHAILANSSSRTRNPAEAGLFVVPAFPVSFCSATRKRCFKSGTFAGGSSCPQYSDVGSDYGCEVGKQVLLQAMWYVKGRCSFREV